MFRHISDVGIRRVIENFKSLFYTKKEIDTQMEAKANTLDIARRIITNKVALTSIPIIIAGDAEAVVLTYQNHQYGEIKKVFVCISSGEYAGASSYNTVYNVAARSSDKLISTLDEGIDLIDGGVGSVKNSVEIKFIYGSGYVSVSVKNNRPKSIYATASFTGINNAPIE